MEHVIIWILDKIVKSFIFSTFLYLFFFFLPCIFTRIPELNNNLPDFVFIATFSLCLLQISRTLFLKLKGINNFIKRQKKEQNDNEFPIYPIIEKAKLYKGVFEYGIPCNDFSPFAFSASLYAKESEEILGK